jgi:hypothetical protein
MTSQHTPVVAQEDPALAHPEAVDDDFDHSEPLLGSPGSVAQSPSQPPRMNLLLGTAPLTQLGILALTLTVWYNVIFRANWILFSFHPVCPTQLNVQQRLTKAPALELCRLNPEHELGAVASTYPYT